MTLPEYIEQTRSTDLVNTVKHAALGLISEVGEVYGVLAKIERGDRIDRAERMTGELGDVAWFLARLTDLTVPDLDPPLALSGGNHLLDSFTYLAERIAEWGHRHLDYNHITEQDRWSRLCWARWASLCYIEGLDPSAVLQANLAKLIDRQARKVLQGDGDHR